MNVTLSFVHIIILSGIINGLVFSVILLWKAENKQANRFLSLLIFSITFSLFTQIVLKWNMYNTNPWLHWFPFSMTYITGPALFFYIRSLTDVDFRFRNVHLWHFALLIFNYPHSIYHLVLGRTNPYPLLHNFTEAMDAYAAFPLLIYSILSFKAIRKYQSQLLDHVSSTENIKLGWLSQLFGIIGISVVMLLIFVIVDYRLLFDFEMEFYEGTAFQYKDILILMHVLTAYWLAIGGFRQAQTASLRAPFKPASSEISENLANVAEKLKNTMHQDLLYLDPVLSLSKLSEHSGVYEKDISASLNQHLQKNFYTFVNEYRVEHVKEQLQDSRNDHLKILSLAYDSGFNSKASFNRIFKEFTGKSPKEFRFDSNQETSQSSPALQ